eukprot:312172_1
MNGHFNHLRLPLVIIRGLNKHPIYRIIQVMVKKEIINDDNTTTSFKEFEGLGFEKALNDKEKNKKNGDETKQENGGWGGWSNSNPDGTFKLNFEWGSFDETTVDLNPSNKIGYGTEAPVYDPNKFETEQPAAILSGEVDAGDTEDETKCSVKCRVYTLEGNKYNEKGIGNVNINTFKTKNCDKVRSRILCRRDGVLSTIINAPIIKEMKFEKVSSSYIRFPVMEQIDITEQTDKSDKPDKSENADNSEKEKEKEEEKEKKR